MLEKIPFDSCMAWFLIKHAIISCVVTEKLYGPEQWENRPYRLNLPFDDSARSYRVCEHKGLLLVTDQRRTLFDAASDCVLRKDESQKRFFAVWVQAEQQPEEIQVTLIHELIHIYLFLITGKIRGCIESLRDPEKKIDQMAYDFVKIWGGYPIESMLRSCSYVGARRKCSISQLRQHFTLHPQPLSYETRRQLIRKDGTSQIMTG